MKKSQFDNIQNKEEDLTGKIYNHRWQPKKQSPGVIHYGWLKINGTIYEFKAFGFKEGKTFDMRIWEVGTEDLIQTTELDLAKQSEAEIMAEEFAYVRSLLNSGEYNRGKDEL